MIFRIFLISIIFLELLPSAAGADNAQGFLYTRSDIGIVRNRFPQKLPWSKDPPANPAVTFDVEIREASGFYNPKIPNGQTGWFNLSSPADNRGVMIVFNAPVFFPITHSTEYAPLDVLLVDSEGRIMQVIQNLKLSELDHDIMPEMPVLAFLFLQGGLTRKLSINPGDMVDYSVFKKSAVIINTDKTRAAQAEPTPLLPTMPVLLAPGANEITNK